MLNRMPHQPPAPGQASIIRSHQRRWPDEIAGHLPVVLPRSPFRGRPSCNLSPPSFGRGGLFFVTPPLAELSPSMGVGFRDDLGGTAMAREQSASDKSAVAKISARNA